MNLETFNKDVIPLQSAMQLLAERILGSTEDAEDVVQEVFLTLWQRREELDKVLKLDRYCLFAVRARCIDIIRKQRHKKEQIDIIPDISDDEILAETEKTEKYCELLCKLMGELPEKQRQAIHLRYFEDNDTYQIGQKLNMSCNNVYTTISRAIQSLKDKLNHLYI
ncbi:MAG: sigma-70 family RNA polymerase sigma factor [Bacteroidales bacterium]|nr:sigma-70 family RNA polymerase sigma factor [Bacteroidales bacterium]